MLIRFSRSTSPLRLAALIWRVLAFTDKYLPKDTSRARSLSGAKTNSRIVPIAECDTCIDLADQAFESGTEVEIGRIAVRFLEHVISEHAGEVMSVLAEKYAPIFMTKRAMR
jgi:hypothetical protein